MTDAAADPRPSPAPSPAPSWRDSLPEPLVKLLKRRPRVHVLRLYGAIGMSGRGGFSLSDEALSGPIEKAFSGRPLAVALAVNSPGGSPAQSSMIAARIRRLSEQKGVPVVAFCEDAAASGGYWLACAADEIYADRSSLVGSIGVIFAGFGLHELLERYGVERRVHTAGDRKLILDPFQPEREEDVADLRAIQSDVHEAFIAYVKGRRGDRLDKAETQGVDLFTGAVFTGAQAETLGLVDGLGHLAAIMKARHGEEIRFREYRARRGLLSRLGVSEALAGALGAVEARALWSRFGM
ncbi:MAG TPA: S49 family peptidase [Paracoccaceae bacterium]|nr:S49 family peptidase [Paracoccaceae bacterium]